MEIKKAAVIGGGTMGNGIAHVFAQAGIPVSIVDVSREAIDRAIQTISGNLDRQVKKGLLEEKDKQPILDLITSSQGISEGIADCGIIIEAATENDEVKLKIFKELDEAAPEGAILASNTSSISITHIASATRRRASVIGMHFMNPAC